MAVRRGIFTAFALLIMRAEEGVDAADTSVVLPRRITLTEKRV
jgi:hypothetical protein